MKHQKDSKQKQRIIHLVAGFLKHTLTLAETEELDDWINASEENMIVFENMTDERTLAEFPELAKKMGIKDSIPWHQNKNHYK